MSETLIASIITGAVGLVLGFVGHLVTSKANVNTAQNQLIDQLQEELHRYRDKTDARLEVLEKENRGYRAFIGLQRDHMAEHGIPLPPWPEGLPR